MRHLHSYIITRQVLYLGISDTPAWVVVKANACMCQTDIFPFRDFFGAAVLTCPRSAVARQHGLTPFSVYQGRWNASFRDLEAEIIPMCEDQGMGVVPWAALGGGQLMPNSEREARDKDPTAHKGYGARESDVKVSEVLEKIADQKSSTVQAIVSPEHPSAIAFIVNNTSSTRPSPIYSTKCPTCFLSLAYRQFNTSRPCLRLCVSSCPRRIYA